MARRLYVDGPFGQIHLRCAGSGQIPLFCFHMSPMSGRIYERFIDYVGRTRLAVAADTPGFGMSDAPPAPPRIADYARAMIAAFEAMSIEGPIDLMGYHTGSMIAAEIAADRPELVRRLILVSAPIFTDREKEEMRNLYAPLKPALDGSHLLARWKGFVHHNLGRGLDLDQVADMFPDGLLGRNIAWWGHRAAFDYAGDLRLPEISQPILLLNPNDDLQEQTRRAPALMRNGRLIELPDWGHGFLDGFTQQAGALAASFLDGPDSDPFAELALPRLRSEQRSEHAA